MLSLFQALKFRKKIIRLYKARVSCSICYKSGEPRYSGMGNICCEILLYQILSFRKKTHFSRGGGGKNLSSGRATTRKQYVRMNWIMVGRMIHGKFLLKNLASLKNEKLLQCSKNIANPVITVLQKWILNDQFIYWDRSLVCKKRKRFWQRAFFARK